MDNITHNPSARRFETVIDGVAAFLSYDVMNDDTLDYNHTIVPSELGGRGVGTALVKYALTYAREHNKKIIASCSFVASYVNKHDEYQDLLV